jgi:hypothetical protein
MTWSKHSRRIDPISRSAKPFCQGEAGAIGLSLNAHSPQSTCDNGAVDPIAVPDHITGSPIPRKNLGDLLCNPLRPRVGCDVDPDASGAPHSLLCLCTSSHRPAVSRFCEINVCGASHHHFAKRATPFSCIHHFRRFPLLKDLRTQPGLVATSDATIVFDHRQLSAITEQVELLAARRQEESRPTARCGCRHAPLLRSAGWHRRPRGSVGQRDRLLPS